MAFFEKDPDVQAQKAAEAALRSKRRDRDGLAERLGIAEAAITSYRAQARQLAADGADDKAISAAEGKMRDAQDRVQTLTGAIGDVDKIVAGLEAEIDRIVDKTCRVETSIAVAAMADRLAKAQAAHQAAALELESAAKEGGLLIPESGAVHHFVLSAREQLVPAIEMIVGALKQHARGVLDGHYPASLPRPAPPPVKLAIVPAPEATVNIFALKNLKFVNREGGVTTICKNKRHDLPKALAEEALRTRVALALSEKKRIEDLEYNAESFFVPAESSCVWLGTPGREAPVRSPRPGGPPVMHSLSPTEFTPNPNTPPPYTLRVPTSPIEPMAVGARKLDAEE